MSGMYEVTVRGPEGRQRYKLRGESTAAGELDDLLDRIARRRFDSFAVDSNPRVPNTAGTSGATRSRRCIGFPR